MSSRVICKGTISSFFVPETDDVQRLLIASYDQSTLRRVWLFLDLIRFYDGIKVLIFHESQSLSLIRIMHCWWSIFVLVCVITSVGKLLSFSLKVGMPEHVLPTKKSKLLHSVYNRYSGYKFCLGICGQNLKVFSWYSLC